MTSSPASAPTAAPEFSPVVRERLRNLVWVLRDCSSHHPRIYEQAFTPEERAQHPFEPGSSLVSLWRACHPEANHVSALVDLGWRGGVIEQSTYDYLAREISAAYPGENLFSLAEVPEPASPSDPELEMSTGIPDWNRSEGTLRFQEVVVRRFQSISRAKACVRILDEFQAQGWPQRIRVSEETRRRDPHLKKTVKSLNAKLDQLKFEFLPSGEISWIILPGREIAPQEFGNLEQ